MIVRVEFEEGDFDSLHDIVLEIFDKELSNEELLKVWNKLPEAIHSEAVRWGMSDSVVKDNIYEYIDNNRNIIND